MTTRKVNNSPSHTSIKNNSASPKIGFDSLVGDIIGLNLEGLKSVWVLFKNPAPYFKAAKTANWEGLYRPSIRLWIALFALTTALKFLWLNQNSPLYGTMSQAIKAVVERINSQAQSSDPQINLTDTALATATNYFINIYILIVPICIFLTIMLLGIIYRAWGEKLSYVIRLRYLFALMITGNLAGLILSLCGPFVTLSVYQTLNFAFLIIMYGLYFVSAYRGAFAHMEPPGRLGRSAAVTAALILTTFIATLIGILIAMVITQRMQFGS